MRLTREAMLELMALADGELDGDALRRAEKLVAENDEARRVVETMRAPALAGVLGDVLDGRSAAADGIADAVMAKLRGGADANADAGGAVVRLADARAKAASRSPRTAIAVASSLAALAIAAGIALYVQARNQADPDLPVASVNVPHGIPSQTAKPLASVTVLEQNQGVQVDEIDSPSHNVHVFEIPVSSAAAAAAFPPNASSVVIMIEDEPSGGSQ
jgi:hypothetical protein